MKKSLILVLCMAMLICMLAACQPQTPEASPTPAPTAGTSVAPSAGTDAYDAKDADEWKYIKAGDEYRYYAWYLYDEVERHGFGTTPMEVYREQTATKIEEEYGASFIVIPNTGENFDNVRASAFSGQPSADGMHTGSPSSLYGNYIYEGVPGGCLTCISDYDIDFSNPAYFSVEAQKQFATFNGKQYYFINGYMGSISTQQICFVNNTVLNLAGVSYTDLYEAVKAGTWTWEMFEDTLARISSLKDQGIYGIPRSMTALNLTNSNNASIIDNVDRGTGSGAIPTFVGNSANAVEAYEFYINLFNKGYVQPLTEGGDSQTLFCNNKLAFMFNYYNRLDNGIWDETKVDFSILPIPKGPKAEDYISEQNWFDAFCVFKGVKNPNGMLKVMKEVFRPFLKVDSEEAKQYQDTLYREKIKDEQSLEMVYLIAEKPVFHHTMMFDSVYRSYCDGAKEEALLEGEYAVRQYMDSIVSSMNTYMDEVTGG